MEIKDHVEKVYRKEAEEYYYPNLERLLRKKNVYLKQIAEYIGINYFTLCHKVNGRRDLKLIEAQKICEFLEVPFSAEIFYTPFKEFRPFKKGNK